MSATQILNILALYSLTASAAIILHNNLELKPEIRYLIIAGGFSKLAAAFGLTHEAFKEMSEAAIRLREAIGEIDFDEIDGFSERYKRVLTFLSDVLCMDIDLEVAYRRYCDKYEEYHPSTYLMPNILTEDEKHAAFIDYVIYRLKENLKENYNIDSRD